MSDCRAYEMVTPPFKAGYPVTMRTVRSGEAFDGAPLLTGVSLGAFAGAYDQVEDLRGGDYAFMRANTGWEARPLDPAPAELVMNPAPSRREGGALVISTVGAAVMMLHRPSESAFGNDLYIRSLFEPLTSVPAEIGPALPAGVVPSEPLGQVYMPNGVAFAGASADLSHVLYYIEPAGQPLEGASNLWPGDTTKLETEVPGPPPLSLYEYVGTGNQHPSLVGVDEQGKLIGRCGTTLGGPVTPEELEGDLRGAVSSTGATVFFTAAECPGEATATPAPDVSEEKPLYELFARIDGQRTIALSELSEVECHHECGQAPAANANFQGASEDGGKVFFLSTQKLLPGAVEDDAKHEEVLDEAVANGGCPAATGGGGCNLYEYEMEPSAGHNHLTLLSAGAPSGSQVQGVSAISDDGSHVYFVARGKLTGANAEGALPQEGAENLYVFESGGGISSTTFIATLSEADTAQWLTAAAPMDTTPDGHALIFESRAPLTAGDQGGTPQVFDYSADSAPPQLLDVSAGSEAQGARVPHPHFVGLQDIGASTHPAVSSDGETIVFSSKADLTPGSGVGAPSNVTNVYEYDRGKVSLISDPSVTEGLAKTFFGAKLLGVSPSGSDIFFETYGALVPQDADTLVDMYDARQEGGFAAPEQTSSCTGSCQIPEMLTPALSFPASATQPAADPPTASPKPNIKPLNRAQKLARALRMCRAKGRKQRRSCEAKARHRYAPVKVKKHATRHG